MHGFKGGGTEKEDDFLVRRLMPLFPKQIMTSDDSVARSFKRIFLDPSLLFV